MTANENIKEVYALINSQKFPATYNDELGQWEINGVAPSESSWSQEDHVFPITLVAVDTAGNTVTMTKDDEEYGDELKLRVLEKSAPTATITAPTTGSVIGENSTTIKVTFKDSGGSGLNQSEAVIKINGVPVSSEQISFNNADDGEIVATVEASDLSDGENKIEAYIKDNDGNISETDTVTFVVSTIAPNLVIDTPIEGTITNNSSIEFKGYASTSLADVTIEKVTISVNSSPEVDMPNESGAADYVSGYNVREFSYSVILNIEGENTIVIKATDSAGKTTEVTRHVVLDTNAPVITDVVLDPHIVDASGSFKITFKVTD